MLQVAASRTRGLQQDPPPRVLPERRCRTSTSEVHAACWSISRPDQFVGARQPARPTSGRLQRARRWIMSPTTKPTRRRRKVVPRASSGECAGFVGPGRTAAVRGPQARTTSGATASAVIRIGDSMTWTPGFASRAARTITAAMSRTHRPPRARREVQPFRRCVQAGVRHRSPITDGGHQARLAMPHLIVLEFALHARMKNGEARLAADALTSEKWRAPWRRVTSAEVSG